MNLLADEGVDKPIVDLLRNNGFDVVYILETNQGALAFVGVPLSIYKHLKVRNAPVWSLHRSPLGLTNGIVEPHLISRKMR